LSSLAITNHALIGHDTGATIARLIAIARADEVRKLVIINTEIPGQTSALDTAVPKV
jgi:pimeloyl-ACP methyl ester carboxylesterase